MANARPVTDPTQGLSVELSTTELREQQSNRDKGIIYEKRAAHLLDETTGHSLISTLLVMSSLPQMHWGITGAVPMCPARRKGKSSYKMGSIDCQYRDAGTQRIDYNVGLDNPVKPTDLAPGEMEPTILENDSTSEETSKEDPEEDRAVVGTVHGDSLAMAYYKALVLASECSGEPPEATDRIEVVVWDDNQAKLFSQQTCREDVQRSFWANCEGALFSRE